MPAAFSTADIHNINLVINAIKSRHIGLFLTLPIGKFYV